MADEYGFDVPRPLATVLDSWIAFLKVYDCRHISAVGLPTTPRWGDIAARLSVHGLWSAEIEEHLTICFAELLRVEFEQRDEKQAIGDGSKSRSSV